MKTLSLLFLLGLATFTFAAPATSPRHGPRNGIDAVRLWNQVAIDASGLDHTPVAIGENRVFGEQIGPCRASRAIAIVHIAMFDAVNAVVGEYESFMEVRAPSGPLSVEAAIGQAAHDALAALFPSQKHTFALRLARELKAINNPKAKANGIDLGKRAAAAILVLKAEDGSQIPEPRVGIDYLTSDLAGHWRQDPISLIPLALGARWSECKTFVIESPSQFRAPPPPAMESSAYALAFNEVKQLGGDDVVTPTVRTPDQTFAGIFWAYDGTPSLCAPPRLYNQVALQIADQMGSSDLEVARLLALINVAMADAGSAIWDSKFYYDVWRPIIGIPRSRRWDWADGCGRW